MMLEEEFTNKYAGVVTENIIQNFANISKCGYIYISHQLWAIHLEITTLAAIKHFIKGMEHAENTLDELMKESNSQEFDLWYGQVTRVVKATYCVFFWESIDSVFRGLLSFHKELDGCTEEDKIHKLQGLVELFMKSTGATFTALKCNEELKRMNDDPEKVKTKQPEIEMTHTRHSERTARGQRGCCTFCVCI